ncbi:hypothetical protein I7I51_02221 [Histoplasma capsulatum]|uniref:Uncharacterized protein n=1 Tax=Ajellomyces capsulatus TaxID=5037 RepID=A0A8A1MCZ2_AJECA|nr:predicted protein [Histoplasma mississippiense (nom. inval.)]EDN09756.1 predicted protein [Histoplasma mississippiense (nom. inval.)]QSS62484.1 hypothetical protein I7I51_02221 [Histoplasma capsulatum]
MGKEWGNNGGPMPAMYHELICTIGAQADIQPWQSLLVMDGLAGDSHVETCSPRAFSGQQATILDPIEGSRGRRCQLSPSVSNNVLGLLSVTAKDDNHRWRRDSISETCTRNALVGLRQSMWIIERVGAAHDLRGGESPRIAADACHTDRRPGFVGMHIQISIHPIDCCESGSPHLNQVLLPSEAGDASM